MSYSLVYVNLHVIYMISHPMEILALHKKKFAIMGDLMVPKKSSQVRLSSMVYINHCSSFDWTPGHPKNQGNILDFKKFNEILMDKSQEKTGDAVDLLYEMQWFI